MNLLIITMLGAAVLTASGCATEKYVNERLASIQARQDSQEQRLDAHETRLEELSVTSSQALQRATDAGVLAQGKFLYTVVLTDDGVTFQTGDAMLSPAAQGHLSSFADQLMTENRSVYLEIQGHTDAAGSEGFNQALGLSRAEAVRSYLHEQGVALDRMATISYGESAPAQANDTAQGRAANRRVEIVVLD